MPHITLTEEQARVLTEAQGPVEVRDARGQALASVTPLSPGDIEAIQQNKLALASGEPAIPGERVQALLRKFDELDQHGGLDEAKAEELLGRLLAGKAL
jgi:hypothetical protein